MRLRLATVIGVPLGQTAGMIGSRSVDRIGAAVISTANAVDMTAPAAKSITPLRKPLQ